jgi:hypothetical protein
MPKDPAPLDRAVAAKSLPAEVGWLAERFHSVFGLTPSGAGLLALSQQIVGDLSGSDLRPELQAWVDTLKRLGEALADAGIRRRNDVRDVLPGGSNGLATVLVTPLSIALPPAAARSLQQARGRLAIHCLSTDASPPPELCTALLRCLRGTPSWRPFAARLATLLRGDDESANSLPPLRRTLLAWLRQSEFIAPPKSGISAPAQTPPPDSDAAEPDRPAQPDDPSPERENSFVLYKLKLGTHADWRLRCGVLAGRDVLTRLECDHVFRRISEDLRGTDPWRRLAGCAAFVIAATGLAPRNFDLLRLAPDPEADACYDLQTGHFCWSMRRLNPRLQEAPTDSAQFLPGGEWLQVAWPVEVADGLSERAGMRPNARSLADLFFDDANEFRRHLEKYLHAHSPTTRMVSFERLAYSFPRLALSVWHDEAYASAFSGDLSLGTRANPHYVNYGPERMTRLLEQLYRHIHLSGAQRRPVDRAAGVRDCPTPQAVAALLGPMLKHAQATLRGRAPNLGIEQLVARTNEMSACTYRLVEFFTAGRPSRTVLLCRASIHLVAPDGFVVVGDKWRLPYHRFRVVPIPHQVADWIRAYLAWMQSVAYRLIRTDPTAATNLLNRLDPASDRPMFVTLRWQARARRVEVCPLASEAVYAPAKARGFPQNFARKLWDAVYRSDGMDSATISATMGRAHRGQEPFGAGSLLVPIEQLARLREVQTRTFDTLDLPRAHLLAGRTVEPPTGIESKALRLDGADASSAPSHRVTKRKFYAEPCPFTRSSADLLALFMTVAAAVSGSPPQDDLALLVVLIIIVDGVSSREEVQAILAALVSNPPYRAGTRWFIDSYSKLLGQRRVGLSAETAIVASRLRAGTRERLDVSTAEEACAVWLTQIDPGRVSAIDALLAATAAAQSLYFPGVVREWSVGRMTSRVLSPRALARELTGRSNPPPEDSSAASPSPPLRSAPLSAQAEIRGMRRLINQACNSSPTAGTEPARMTALRLALGALDASRMQLPARLMLSAIRHVANKVPAPATVKRYFLAQLRFVLLLTETAGDEHEVLAQDWAEPWQRLDSRKRLSKADRQIQKVAANHLAAALGAHWRAGDTGLFRVQPGTYVSYPLDADVARAVELMAATEAPIALREGAIALTHVALAAPTRPDERRHLRAGDLAFLGQDALLVVSTGTSSNLKSDNAGRILELALSEQVSRQLQAWYRDRREALDAKKRTYLFSDLAQSTFAQSHEIEALVHAALREATGDATLTAWHLRHAAINRRMRPLLEPGRAPHRALEARNALLSEVISNGHASIRTSTQNYLAFFDGLRRVWQERLLAAVGFERSDALVAKVLKESQGAIRAARWRRGLSTEQAHAGRVLEALRRIGAQAMDLDTLVVAAAGEASPTTQAFPDAREQWLAVYLFARCSGTNREVACHLAGCSTSLAEKAETVLQRETARSIRSLQAQHAQLRLHPTLRGDIDALSCAFEGVIWEPALVRAILSAIEDVDRAWRIQAPTDLERLRALLAACLTAGFRSVLTVSNSPRRDPALEQHAAGIDGLHVEHLAPRQFTKAVLGRLAFLPKSMDLKGRARNQPHSMFVVTVNVLAAVLASVRPEILR